MKNLSALCVLLSALNLSAQTNASYILFDHSNAGNNGHMVCGNSALNVWTNNGNFGDGSPSISYSSVSNCWVVSGLSGGEWTLAAPVNPWPDGAAVQLYNASGAITGYYTNYYLTFYGFIPPSFTNWTIQTKGYWPVAGDTVSFRASGRNLSSGINSNQLVVAVDGNPVFTGPWTTGAGLAWSLSGNVQWDGTNLNYAASFTSGDTNTPSAVDYGTIASAVVGTNTWSWQVNGDTNGLRFESAMITASRAPANDAPQHLFVAGTGGIIVTNASGSRFSVLVNSGTNGLIFVPQ